MSCVWKKNDCLVIGIIFGLMALLTLMPVLSTEFSVGSEQTETRNDMEDFKNLLREMIEIERKQLK